MSEQPEFFTATFAANLDRAALAERWVRMLGCDRTTALEIIESLQAKIAVEILTSPPREPLPDEQRWRVFPVYD